MPVAPRRYRILDEKFRCHADRYILQCLAAMLALFAVLSVLDAVTQTVLVASLGASCFIAFTMPHVASARPRYMVGGYLIGTLCGCSMTLLGHLVVIDWLPNAHIALAALGVGLAMFLMVVTDTEHPPAAALALGFALNPWNAETVVVVMGGIFALVGIKQILRPHLMDLL